MLDMLKSVHYRSTLPGAIIDKIVETNEWMTITMDLKAYWMFPGDIVTNQMFTMVTEGLKVNSHDLKQYLLQSGSGKLPEDVRDACFHALRCGARNFSHYANNAEGTKKEGCLWKTRYDTYWQGVDADHFSTNGGKMHSHICLFEADEVNVMDALVTQDSRHELLSSHISKTIPFIEALVAGIRRGFQEKKFIVNNFTVPHLSNLQVKLDRRGEHHYYHNCWTIKCTARGRIRKMKSGPRLALSQKRFYNPATDGTRHEYEDAEDFRTAQRALRFYTGDVLDEL